MQQCNLALDEQFANHTHWNYCNVVILLWQQNVICGYGDIFLSTIVAELVGI